MIAFLTIFLNLPRKCLIPQKDACFDLKHVRLNFRSVKLVLESVQFCLKSVRFKARKMFIFIF